MTKRELSQLYYLNKEIKYLTQRIEALESKCTATTKPITDLPRGGLPPELLEEYIELKSLLEKRLKESVCIQTKIEEFIKDIEDPTTRLIFSLRHIEGLTWQQIEKQINYSYSSRHLYRVYNKTCQSMSVKDEL